MTRHLLALALAASAIACGGTETDGNLVSNEAALFEDCQTIISELRTATGQVTYLSKNATKDRVGLLGKLDAASLKLTEAKPLDAVQKLGDFESQVSILAATGKLAPSSDPLIVPQVTPQTLLDLAAMAKACIIPPAPVLAQ